MRPLSQAQPLRIPTPGAVLNADLVVPVDARGVVLFVHGSGSSRHSHRNQFVARTLQESSFGTLLMDLLTAEEGHIDNQTRELRFDIDLLADRLMAVVDWTGHQPALKHLPLGLFGASTGAAADGRGRQASRGALRRLSWRPPGPRGGRVEKGDGANDADRRQL